MLILDMKFQVCEIIGGLKFRIPKCAFRGLEIFGGLTFLCSHKFILVQNVGWTADYLGL